MIIVAPEDGGQSGKVSNMVNSAVRQLSVAAET
jgi:hypothetical protein